MKDFFSKTYVVAGIAVATLIVGVIILSKLPKTENPDGDDKAKK